MSLSPSLNSLMSQFRERFPALRREQDGQPVVFFDGPAGTQVPQSVIDAVSHYYVKCNANHGGDFITSRESDAWIDEAHQGIADLMGAANPNEIVFGQNMTSLTFALSRALSQQWNPGDEVIVTRLDHDANVSPWVLAAKDRGLHVEYVDINQDDCTLDLENYQRALSSQTCFVAVGAASNSTGTINPVKEIVRQAHEVGAKTFVDAVHYAPHAKIDVADWGADFVACSTYKFFGPHLGALWGKYELLDSLDAYKVRPAPSSPPGKWMTGTQSHEAIVGALAAVDYLAELGREVKNDQSLDRKEALKHAYDAIIEYERMLCLLMLEGLSQIPGVKVWGIKDRARIEERMPTVSITHDRLRPAEVAKALGDQGIFVWHGNYYALQLTETLGLEPDGMVRIGLVHYNTPAEVDRFLFALSAL